MTAPPRAWLVLRILVGLPFVASGVFNAINWDASNQFNAILLGSAAPVLTILGVLQIAGGLSIISGYQMKWGALLLLAFLLPATLRHFLAGLIGVMLFFLLAAWNQRRVPKSTLGTS